MAVCTLGAVLWLPAAIIPSMNVNGASRPHSQDHELEAGETPVLPEKGEGGSETGALGIGSSDCPDFQDGAEQEIGGRPPKAGFQTGVGFSMKIAPGVPARRTCRKTRNRK